MSEHRFEGVPIVLDDDHLRSDVVLEGMARMLGEVFLRWSRIERCELDGHVITRRFERGESDWEWICDRCQYAPRFEEVPA